MIPRKIHYCWFGPAPLSPLARTCIESWHKYMPDYEFKLWDESNSGFEENDYAREAYEARKFAFVSDYVRLKALKEEGGIYLDTDVEVFKPFDGLLETKAFAGFEGSKHCPVGTCVLGSEAGGDWVSGMLQAYQGRHFIKPDGSMDLTTNVVFITDILKAGGLRTDGTLQTFKDLTIFPVEWFSPRLTTGEYVRTDNTFSDHHGVASWREGASLKSKILGLLGQKAATGIIKLKRRILG